MTSRDHSKMDLIVYLAQKNTPINRKQLIKQVKHITGVDSLRKISDNHGTMKHLLNIMNENADDEFNDNKLMVYSLKKDISSLCGLFEILDYTHRWYFLDTPYYNDLKPSVVEYFNAKLAEAGLSELDDYNTLLLTEYIYYPSILKYIFACDSSSLKFIDDNDQFEIASLHHLQADASNELSDEVRGQIIDLVQEIHNALQSQYHPILGMFKSMVLKDRSLTNKYSISSKQIDHDIYNIEHPTLWDVANKAGEKYMNSPDGLDLSVRMNALRGTDTADD